MSFNVCLTGGAPWGFRLQGGKEFGQPLRIAKINPGSKALHSGLKIGDIVESINGDKTQGLMHNEALKIIKSAPNTLELGLRKEESALPNGEINGLSQTYSPASPQLETELGNMEQWRTKSPTPPNVPPKPKKWIPVRGTPKKWSPPSGSHWAPPPQPPTANDSNQWTPPPPPSRIYRAAPTAAGAPFRREYQPAPLGGVPTTMTSSVGTVESSQPAGQDSPPLSPSIVSAFAVARELKQKTARVPTLAHYETVTAEHHDTLPQSPTRPSRGMNIFMKQQSRLNKEEAGQLQVDGKSFEENNNKPLIHPGTSSASNPKPLEVNVIEDKPFRSSSLSPQTGVWKSNSNAPFLPTEQQDFHDRGDNSLKDMSHVWAPSGNGTLKKEYRPIRLDTSSLANGKKPISPQPSPVAPPVPAQPNFASSETSTLSSLSSPGVNPPQTFSSAAGIQLSNTSSHLPKSQSPTVTLLQKTRDDVPSPPSYIAGEIPKGAVYVGSKEMVDGDVKHTDTFYMLPAHEQTVTRTITEHKAPKYGGIGPVEEETGVPTGLRSTIDDDRQHDWYKEMFKSLHKTEKPEERWTDSRKEENPYTPTYQFPEPEPESKEETETNPYVPGYELLYHSPTDESKRAMPDRSQSVSTNVYESRYNNTGERNPWLPDARAQPDRYRVQPRSIIDYEPGYSSIAFQEAKKDDEPPDEPEDESRINNPPIEKPGQYSSYTLPAHLRKKANAEKVPITRRSLSPTEQKSTYLHVLKGGEVPVSGFRKPVPEPTTHHAANHEDIALLHQYKTLLTCLLNSSDQTFDQSTLQALFVPLTSLLRIPSAVKTPQNTYAHSHAKALHGVQIDNHKSRLITPPELSRHDESYYLTSTLSRSSKETFPCGNPLEIVQNTKMSRNTQPLCPERKENSVPFSFTKAMGVGEVSPEFLAPAGGEFGKYPIGHSSEYNEKSKVLSSDNFDGPSFRTSSLDLSTSKSFSYARRETPQEDIQDKISMFDTGDGECPDWMNDLTSSARLSWNSNSLQFETVNNCNTNLGTGSVSSRSPLDSECGAKRLKQNVVQEASSTIINQCKRSSLDKMPMRPSKDELSTVQHDLVTSDPVEKEFLQMSDEAVLDQLNKNFQQRRKAKSECSDRSSKLDSSAYHIYAQGLLSSSAGKSKKFTKIQSCYENLQKVADLEQEVEMVESLSKSMNNGNWYSLSCSGSELSTSWEPSVFKTVTKMAENINEMEDLHAELEEAQSKKEFLYRAHNLEDYKWRAERDLGLKKKSTFVDEIVPIYQDFDGQINLNTEVKRKPSSDKDLKRSLSFSELKHKYTELETKSEDSSAASKRRNSESTLSFDELMKAFDNIDCSEEGIELDAHVAVLEQERRSSSSSSFSSSSLSEESVILRNPDVLSQSASSLQKETDRFVDVTKSDFSLPSQAKPALQVRAFSEIFDSPPKNISGPIRSFSAKQSNFASPQFSFDNPNIEDKSTEVVADENPVRSLDRATFKPKKVPSIVDKFKDSLVLSSKAEAKVRKSYQLSNSQANFDDLKLCFENGQSKQLSVASKKTTGLNFLHTKRLSKSEPNLDNCSDADDFPENNSSPGDGKVHLPVFSTVFSPVKHGQKLVAESPFLKNNSPKPFIPHQTSTVTKSFSSVRPLIQTFNSSAKPGKADGIPGTTSSSNCNPSVAQSVYHNKAAVHTPVFSSVFTKQPKTPVGQCYKKPALHTPVYASVISKPVQVSYVEQPVVLKQYGVLASTPFESPQSLSPEPPEVPSKNFPRQFNDPADKENGSNPSHKNLPAPSGFALIGKPASPASFQVRNFRPLAVENESKSNECLEKLRSDKQPPGTSEKQGDGKDRYPNLEELRKEVLGETHPGPEQYLSNKHYNPKQMRPDFIDRSFSRDSAFASDLSPSSPIKDSPRSFKSIKEMKMSSSSRFTRTLSEGTNIAESLEDVKPLTRKSKSFTDFLLRSNDFDELRSMYEKHGGYSDDESSDDELYLFNIRRTVSGDLSDIKNKFEDRGRFNVENLDIPSPPPPPPLPRTFGVFGSKQTNKVIIGHRFGQVDQSANRTSQLKQKFEQKKPESLSYNKSGIPPMLPPRSYKKYHTLPSTKPRQGYGGRHLGNNSKVELGPVPQSVTRVITPKSPPVGKVKKPRPRSSLSAAEQLGVKSPSPIKINAGVPSHHYSSSDVPVNRSPAGSIDRKTRDEREAKRKEILRQYEEEERKKKVIEEQKKNEARRHSDYFTSKQKSPIPGDRFNEGLADIRGPVSPRMTATKRAPGVEIKGKARAIYNFKAENPKELSFKKGDTILLTRQIDMNWYEGEHHGCVGIFPVNYVEVLTSLETATALAFGILEGRGRAKYNFNAQTAVELPLKKGEEVILLRRVDDNWFEAKVGTRQGIVPVSYIDVTQQPGTPLATPSISVSTTPARGSPVGPLSPAQYNGPTRTQSTDLSPNYRGQRPGTRPTSQQSPKYTGDRLSPVQQNQMMDHRASPAQFAVVNDRFDGARQPYSETQPTVIKTSSMVTQSAPRQQYQPPPPPTQHQQYQPPPPQHHQGAPVNRMGEPQGRRDMREQELPVYRAIYTYMPQNEDELEMREGDTVYVMEKCDDGWFVGTSARTRQFGTFPGNYVVQS